ncbi:MAG TPA: hypothetical protein DCL48_00260, partial [Alphaproteobacteria bacterium]|nr:hypothetical protein [Alphaproteobacteria bacterium]
MTTTMNKNAQRRATTLRRNLFAGSALALALMAPGQAMAACSSNAFGPVFSVVCDGTNPNGNPFAGGISSNTNTYDQSFLTLQSDVVVLTGADEGVRFDILTGDGTIRSDALAIT